MPLPLLLEVLWCVSIHLYPSLATRCYLGGCLGHLMPSWLQLELQLRHTTHKACHSKYATLCQQGQAIVHSASLADLEARPA